MAALNCLFAKIDVYHSSFSKNNPVRITCSKPAMETSKQ